MAELSVQAITVSGLEPVFEPVTALGDTVNQVPGDVFLHFKNTGSVGSATATIEPATAAKEVAGWGVLTVADVEVAVPVGEERLVGPFLRNPFGTVLTIGYTGTGVADLEVAAIRLPS